MRITVIDGLGGGLGSQIIKAFNNKLNNSVELIALGINSVATSMMIKEGAARGATGENAIRTIVQRCDIIVGPLGIIIPNSMMGEVTPAIAEAIANSPAKRFLLGIKQPHFELVGINEELSINDLIGELTKKTETYILKNDR